jgi:hypothetical protein
MSRAPHMERLIPSHSHSTKLETLTGAWTDTMPLVSATIIIMATEISNVRSLARLSLLLSRDFLSNNRSWVVLQESPSTSASFLSLEGVCGRAMQSDMTPGVC